jgi:peptide/nickel transport system permease protein
MAHYIVRRGLQSFVLMWISTLIGFTIYQLAPGGPLQFMDNDPRRSEADIVRLQHLGGLDRPVFVQYVSWVAGEDWFGGLSFLKGWQSGRCVASPGICARGILRLDFGRSFHFQGEPVINLIAERIPATFLLAFSSLLISVGIGVPLGIISALNSRRWPDHVIRISTVLLNTVPEWWIGLVLLIVLGSYLKLVPLGGMETIGDGSLPDRLRHLLLPATVSAIGGWIGFSRILRFEMLEVLNQDYVRTARAKGLSQSLVIWRHVLRNALMPFVTGLGGIFLLILSGSVLFEIIFSWPGMGRLAIEAINSRDYPVMMAIFIISSFLGILGLLMVDILYGAVDPRVHYGERQ